MKKRILSILAIALVVANVNAAGVSTVDGNGKRDAKVETVNNDANVKYVGETKDNGIVFDVNYENPKNQRFVLVISNSQGDVLFNQSYRDAAFRKTIMVKKDSDAAGSVTFSVRSNGDEIFSKTFQIDTEAQVIRKVTVKPVN
ncbi:MULTISPECIES: hypothetical protein [Chitinophagaceae]